MVSNSSKIFLYNWDKTSQKPISTLIRMECKKQQQQQERHDQHLQEIFSMREFYEQHNKKQKQYEKQKQEREQQHQDQKHQQQQQHNKKQLYLAFDKLLKKSKREGNCFLPKRKRRRRAASLHAANPFANNSSGSGSRSNRKCGGFENCNGEERNKFTVSRRKRRNSLKYLYNIYDCDPNANGTRTSTTPTTSLLKAKEKQRKMREMREMKMNEYDFFNENDFTTKKVLCSELSFNCNLVRKRRSNILEKRKDYNLYLSGNDKIVNRKDFQTRIICPICRGKTTTELSSSLNSNGPCQCIVPSILESSHSSSSFLLSTALPKKFGKLQDENQHKYMKMFKFCKSKVGNICRHCSKEHLTNNFTKARKVQMGGTYKIASTIISSKEEALQSKHSLLMLQNMEKSRRSSYLTESNNDKYITERLQQKQHQQQQQQQQNRCVKQEHNISDDEVVLRRVPHNENYFNDNVIHTTWCTKTYMSSFIQFTQFLILFIQMQSNNLIRSKYLSTTKIKKTNLINSLNYSLTRTRSRIRTHCAKFHQRFNITKINNKTIIKPKEHLSNISSAVNKSSPVLLSVPVCVYPPPPALSSYTLSKRLIKNLCNIIKCTTIRSSTILFSRNSTVKSTSSLSPSLLSSFSFPHTLSTTKIPSYNNQTKEKALPIPKVFSNIDEGCYFTYDFPKNNKDKFHPSKGKYQCMPKSLYLKYFLTFMTTLMLLVPFTSAQNVILQTSELESRLESFKPLKSSSLVIPPSLPPKNQNDSVVLEKREGICKSMDLRNSFADFHVVKNCTVIEGFLFLGLVSDAGANQSLLENLSFPLLTEVTEYVLVYRLHNVRSLGQLFPNLSIIRGRELFEGYALIVFSNPALEEIGLTKLISIPRGGVRIQDNVRLCYANTIDWNQIFSNSTELLSIFRNRKEEECPKCPGGGKHDDNNNPNNMDCKDRMGVPRCWNSVSCQKICPPECPNNCYDSRTCCDKACIGGCTKNPRECTACRHFSIHNNTCTRTCPDNYYAYLDRRCVTSEDCLKIALKYQHSNQETLVAFNKTCSTRCPQGYNKENSTCTLCKGECTKACQGDLVDSVTRAKEFYGCTEIVTNGLTISIKLGGPHVYKELEYSFGAIKTIRTFLKVQRTYAVPSLGFFKNLQEIKGERLDEDKFALYVLENNDLEKIWNQDQRVKISKGRVFFHFNPKLCFSIIEAIRPMMSNNASFDKNEVATDSNGSRGSCNTTTLVLRAKSVLSTTVILEIVEPMKFPDERAFIGYQFFHKQTEENVTKHSYRLCDESWTVSDPKREGSLVVNMLQPYTQYAFYVKTMTISSEILSGESEIIYVRTKPAQPSYVVNLSAFSNSSSEIVVHWRPPSIINGELDFYTIQAKIDLTLKVEERDYCKDPVVTVDTPLTSYDPEKTSPKGTPSGGGGSGSGAEDCNCSASSKTGPSANKNAGLDEKQDAKVHSDIDFENAVQNFVYVKRVDKDHPSSPKRKRRSTEGPPEESILLHTAREYRTNDIRDASEQNSKGFLENKTINRVSKPSRNDSVILKDANSTVFEENGRYYKLVTANVYNGVTEYVFKNLKHFTFYSIAVRACRKSIKDEKNSTKFCGPYINREARTMKLDNVDKVQNFVVEEVTNSSIRSGVRLKWDPPGNPNGAVVSYTIIYQLQAQDSVFDKKCITETYYRNLTKGYILSNLPYGSYNVSVTANTLAGVGLPSETRYFEIKEPKMPPLKIALIVVVCLFALALLILTCIYIRKKSKPDNILMIPAINPNYFVNQPYIPDEWEVPRKKIIQLTPLGQGSFGMVYEGFLKGDDGDGDEGIPCAIKTVNESATDRERQNFLDEASIMKSFETHHVVRLLGVCSIGQPALVVMELMRRGDLKTYLRNHRPENNRDDTVLSTFGPAEMPEPPPSLDRILLMALQIADGMAYLSAKKFVHRDLAARNCMVAQDLTVKIGDFGMTRDVYETDYYRKGTKGLLPVRWMPPESLRDGVYSSASDVFSYGVVLWEMATLAAQPYQGYSNDQVLRFVIDGGVMERPENCPDELYNLMQKCWHHRPSARPTFLEIINMLIPYADDTFRELSFYNSPLGQQQLLKDRNEMYITDDHDNNMDEANTPLNGVDYDGLNYGNQSSVEPVDESPIIRGGEDEGHLHSPHSLVSGMNINSASDGQSKNSFNLSHKLHGGNSNLNMHQQQQKQQQQHQNQSHQPYQNRQSRSSFPHILHDANATGNETDDTGYQVYDPSPKYHDHHHGSYDNHDNDEEEDDIDGKLLGQNLLPVPKNSSSGKRQPVIVATSSSMPDEITSGTPMISSSLHPSTASAASSNASSTATSGPTGKFLSLKGAAADTLLPAASRIKQLFNHKRSNSNSSHKSTGNNSGSLSNKNQHPLLPLQSNQNQSIGSSNSPFKPELSTIESGGSGSAGSYTVATPSSKNNTPGYKPLNESINTSGISAVSSTPYSSSSAPPKSSSSVSSARPKAISSLNFINTSTNPNYEPFDNLSLNRQKNTAASNLSSSAARPFRHISENPNYVIMTDSVPTSSPPPYQDSESVSQSLMDRSSNMDPAYTEMLPLKPMVAMSLKEKWLRDQQYQGHPPHQQQPPPNGFVGPESE